MDNKGWEVVRHTLLLAIFILVVGCDQKDRTSSDSNANLDVGQNTQQEDGDEVGVEQSSVYWEAVDSSQETYIEFDWSSSKLVEYKLISAGGLCYTSRESHSWSITSGDPNIDETVTIDYALVHDDMVNVELFKQDEDIFKYSSLCAETSIWNGTYEGGFVRGFSDYQYWVISVPETTGYKLNDELECFETELIEQWWMIDTFVTTNGDLSFGAEYTSESQTGFVDMEKVDISPSEIGPLCQQ